MLDKETQEVLIKDIKDQLNQVLIRLRIHDVVNPSDSAYNASTFQNIKYIIENIIKDLESGDDSNIKDMTSSVLSYYSSSANC